MNASIFLNWLDWMSHHYPDITAFIVFIIVLVWLTVKGHGLIGRFKKTEQLCLDMHDKKLPALEQKMDEKFQKIEDKFEERFQRMDEKFEERFRKMDEKFEERFQKIDEKFQKVDSQFAAVNEQLVDIKLMIKKIDTYLSTTAPKYPG